MGTLFRGERQEKGQKYLFTNNGKELLLEKLAGTDGLGDLKGLEKLTIRSTMSDVSRQLSKISYRLHNLQELNLIFCWGSKVLPDELGQLENLKILRLCSTQQPAGSWKLLPDTISELKRLQELKISSCRELTCLPDSLGDLQALEVLRLDDCRKLSILPPTIGNLSTLLELDMQGCPLECLPDSLCELENLRRVRISGCRISRLPEHFGNLSGLQELLICGMSGKECVLEYVPESFFRLPNLTRLYLEWFRGARLPDELYQLRSLTELVIVSSWRLRTLPTAIDRFPSLRKLDVIDCEKLSTLPDRLGTLLPLEELRISSCEALKAIPTTIGQLQHLRKLEISSNGDILPLPDSIGGLTSLQELICPNIPATICRLHNLNKLVVTDTHLKASLPTEMGDLEKLEALEFVRCKGLTTLPDSLGNLTNLKLLRLETCGDLLSLPSSLVQLHNLEVLEMKDCPNVTGLPDGLAQLVNLRELKLSKTHYGIRNWDQLIAIDMPPRLRIIHSWILGSYGRAPNNAYNDRAMTSFLTKNPYVHSVGEMDDDRTWGQDHMLALNKFRPLLEGQDGSYLSVPASLLPTMLDMVNRRLKQKYGNALVIYALIRSLPAWYWIGLGSSRKRKLRDEEVHVRDSSS